MKKCVLVRATVLLLLFLITLPGTPYATDIYWTDYQQPFSPNVHIFQPGSYAIESVAIIVNLPEYVIKRRENMTLAFQIVSRTNCNDTTDFGCFTPYIRVNSSWFNKYEIPVNPFPREQTQEVVIKSMNLIAGQNIIKATFQWKGNLHCASEGCGYVIQKVYFKDVPALFTAEPSPPTNDIESSGPDVHKRSFNDNSEEPFGDMGKLVEPFESLEDTISEEQLDVRNLIKRYQRYLQINKERLFKNAARRTDLRIRAEVYYLNLYMYLYKFLQNKGAKIWTEFPTGSEKSDILITYQGHLYGIEVKSFVDVAEYRKTIKQAALYGKQLQLKEITLIFFIESIDKENRNTYETEYTDGTTGVTVKPVFVETGI